MAMVKISNGEVTQIVSRGAYESQYKSIGFRIVMDDEEAANESELVNVDGLSEDKGTNIDLSSKDKNDEINIDINDVDEFEELLEKPISQWSSDELKKFVTAKDIDTSSAKKISEVRTIVKNYLDEQIKNGANI